jgi:hypothetical protein
MPPNFSLSNRIRSVNSTLCVALEAPNLQAPCLRATSQTFAMVRSRANPRMNHWNPEASSPCRLLADWVYKPRYRPSLC